MFAIKKYGFDNFHIDECFDVAQTPEELDEKERYWIKYYDATNPLFGYNCESGGNPNKKASKQTRARLSAAQKKRFSNESNKEYMFRRTQSEETKAKISASKRGTPGRPMSDDNLEKLNEAKRKPIICLTTGETFYYMKDALEKYGIKSQGSLSLACHGKRLHCGKLEDGTKLKWSLWGG
jgi:group I intron endonuclease